MRIHSKTFSEFFMNSSSSDFRRSSHFKCALQREMAKKSIKTPILGVQGRLRSFHIIDVGTTESLSAVLVMIICIIWWKPCVYLIWSWFGGPTRKWHQDRQTDGRTELR